MIDVGWMIARASGDKGTEEINWFEERNVHFGSFDDFVDQMESEVTPSKSKDKVSMVAPYVYDSSCVVNGRHGPYMYRDFENIALYTMLVLDIDGGMTINQAYQRYGHVEFLLHSSFNSGVIDRKTNKACERFRMFLPLSEHVGLDDYYERKDVFKTHFVGADKSSFTRGRHFYMPSVRVGYEDEYVFDHNIPDDEKRLNLYDIKVPPKPVYIRPAASSIVPTVVNNEDRELLLAEIIKCDLDEYDDWYKCLYLMIRVGFSDEVLYEISEDDEESLCKIESVIAEYHADVDDPSEDINIDYALNGLCKFIRETGGDPEFEKPTHKSFDRWMASKMKIKGKLSGFPT